MQEIKRENTLVIDAHPLGFRPNTIALHESIFQQYRFSPEQVISIEYSSYKKQIFIKLTSKTILEQTLLQHKDKFTYVENGIEYILNVDVECGSKVTALVSIIPSEITGQQVQHFFQQFGLIQRIIPLSFPNSHRYPIYSGRQLIVFTKLYKSLPSYVELYGHPIQILTSDRPKACNICGEDNHLAAECRHGNQQSAQVKAPQKPYQFDIDKTRKVALSAEEFPTISVSTISSVNKPKEVKSFDSLSLSSTSVQENITKDIVTGQGEIAHDTSSFATVLPAPPHDSPHLPSLTPVSASECSSKDIGCVLPKKNDEQCVESSVKESDSECSSFEKHSDPELSAKRRVKKKIHFSNPVVGKQKV